MDFSLTVVEKPCAWTNYPRWRLSRIVCGCEFLKYRGSFAGKHVLAKSRRSRCQALARHFYYFESNSAWSIVERSEADHLLIGKSRYRQPPSANTNDPFLLGLPSGVGGKKRTSSADILSHAKPKPSVIVVKVYIHLPTLLIFDTLLLIQGSSVVSVPVIRSTARTKSRSSLLVLACLSNFMIIMA